MKKALKRYISESKKMQDKEPNTIEAYRREIENFIAFLEYKKQTSSIEDFNRENIIEYLDYIKDKSTNTKNRFITIIKNFAMYCTNVLDLQVDGKIMFITRIKQKKKIIHILNKEQIKQLREYVLLHETIREFTIIELFIRTGMRLNEVTTLRWEDIDFINDNINVLEGKSGDRQIPLHPSLKETLLKYKEELGRYEYVIVNLRDKQPITKDGLSYVVKNLVSKAGLPSYVTPHTFRHTFATELLRSSNNLQVVKNVLGHSDISTTQIYLHLNKEDSKKAIMEMD